MADVWTNLLRGMTAFAHTRAARSVGSTFADCGALLESLVPGSSGSTKAALEQLQAAIDASAEVFEPLIDAVDEQAGIAADAVVRMSTEIGASGFDLAAAGRASVQLGRFFHALGKAIDLLADAASEQLPPGATAVQKQTVRNDIRNIKRPWQEPFLQVQSDAQGSLNRLGRVFGIDNATRKVGEQLEWRRDQYELRAVIVGANATLGDLRLDGVSLEAFFNFAAKATLGLRIRTRIAAGLRGDRMLEKIVPGGRPAESEPAMVSLDTVNGLGFGEGADKRVTLPARFSQPGLELREFAIATPLHGNDAQRSRIDLMATVAGKLESVLAVVAEDGGLIVRWREQGGAPIEVLPKPPVGVGIKFDAGLIHGGGFLGYNEQRSEYGGAFDLKVAQLRVTAVGLLSFDPEFSMVVAIGVRFWPRIELSFGFTLNAVGGLLAINRTLSMPALDARLKDGVVDNLLFPDDPVPIAPQLLAQLSDVFPRKSGAFVIGPMAELGWGSQASIVRAKIGVILELPDPQALVILGSAQIIVPPEVKSEKLRILDFRADLSAFVSDSMFLTKVDLRQSKMAGISVSGQIGTLIRWAGEATFACSAGGFYPGYPAPPELADLRRITIKPSPPPPLKIDVSGYAALTTSSVQFGGKAQFEAKLGPAGAYGTIEINALFEWAPHLRFEFRISAEVGVKVFGKTFASVGLSGTIGGVSPWRLDGKVTVKLLVKKTFRVGKTWGEQLASPPPAVDAISLVADALNRPDAWHAVLPAGVGNELQLVEDKRSPRLFHPLALIEAKQHTAPLELEINRIGSSRLQAPTMRLYLADPAIGGQPAAGAATIVDDFAPGQYLDLDRDEQLARPNFERLAAGLRITPAAGARHGTPRDMDVAWETVYPHQQRASDRGLSAWLLEVSASQVLAHSAAGLAERYAHRNRYLNPVPAEEIKVAAPGLRAVRDKHSLAAIGVQDGFVTMAEAANLGKRAARQGTDVQLVAMGVD